MIATIPLSKGGESFKRTGDVTSGTCWWSTTLIEWEKERKVAEEDSSIWCWTRLSQQVLVLKPTQDSECKKLLTRPRLFKTGDAFKCMFFLQLTSIEIIDQVRFRLCFLPTCLFLFRASILQLFYINAVETKKKVSSSFTSVPIHRGIAFIEFIMKLYSPGNGFVLRGPGRVQIDGGVEYIGERAAAVALVPVRPVNSRIATRFDTITRPVNQRVHPWIRTVNISVKKKQCASHKRVRKKQNKTKINKNVHNR